MNERKITLKQVGWKIKGIATINYWGGGQGKIEMDSSTIIGNLTKDKLIACINDGQFGCESIDSAEVDIYALYTRGYYELHKTIHISNKQLNKNNVKIGTYNGV